MDKAIANAFKWRLNQVNKEWDFQTCFIRCRWKFRMPFQPIAFLHYKTILRNSQLAFRVGLADYEEQWIRVQLLTICPLPWSCESGTCMHLATGFDSVSSLLESCPCIHNNRAHVVPFNNIQCKSQLNNPGKKAIVQSFPTHVCMSAIVNMHTCKSFKARR